MPAPGWPRPRSCTPAGPRETEYNRIYPLVRKAHRMNELTCRPHSFWEHDDMVNLHPVHAGSCHITFRAARNLDQYLRRLAAARGETLSEAIRHILWVEVRAALLRAEIT